MFASNDENRPIDSVSHENYSGKSFKKMSIIKTVAWTLVHKLTNAVQKETEKRGRSALISQTAFYISKDLWREF